MASDCGERHYRRCHDGTKRPAAPPGIFAPEPRHAPGSSPGPFSDVDPGFRFLFAHLRDARQQFENEGDGGRLAAVTALGGLWQFIVHSKSRSRIACKSPSSTSRPHSQPSKKTSCFRYTSRFLAVVAPFRSCACGNDWTRGRHGATAFANRSYTRQSRTRAVAAHLTKLGVKTGRGGRVTANTVRHWCDEVAIDGHGLAAQLCHSILSEIEDSDFATSSRGEAQIRVLDKLSAWVWGIIPASPKPS